MLSGGKVKTVYACSQCGAEHPRWQGQCRECGQWNVLVEQRVPSRTARQSSTAAAAADVRPLGEIEDTALQGWPSGIEEFDRVLGGALLPGMTMLLAGEPGLGKSTLLLQVAAALSQQGNGVLYIAGEESPSQLKARAGRLGIGLAPVDVASATTYDEITAAIEESSYRVVMVDSIQTVACAWLESPPGTVAQVRGAAAGLIRLAKTRGFSLCLVGHVTKEGLVAGPKVLEHMVDTVLSFEGDSAHLYRILRAVKNRFGTVAEIGLFEMTAKGLREVANPSAFFLSQCEAASRTGTVVTGFCDGNRPLLVETQALVTAAAYGSPQRVAGGVDAKKLALLLAILEKRCGYPMATHDVFVSVAGGLRVTSPSVDLPLLAAIVSSLTGQPVHSRMLVLGEVGLAGELRAVMRAEPIVAEAARLGYETVVLPEVNCRALTGTDLSLVGAADLESALESIFK